MRGALVLSLLVLFSAMVLGLGWYFGWHSLAPRMEQIGEGFQGREEMYKAAPKDGGTPGANGGAEAGGEKKKGEDEPIEAEFREEKGT